MEYVYKAKGIALLKQRIGKAIKKPFIKHISLPIKQAQEIMEELNQPRIDKYFEYTTKSNSVNAAAVVLCIKPNDLIERLNAPQPAKLLMDIAEARTKIKMLEEAGDALAKTTNYNTLIERWNKAKTL
jgi:pyrroline-5-carboxylate reductase